MWHIASMFALPTDHGAPRFKSAISGFSFNVTSSLHAPLSQSAEERELVTSNDKPRTVAYRRIIEASIYVS
jgi:hypothetical protein